MTRAYHSTHVGPLVTDYEELTWRVPVARSDRVRVREHTCICQVQSYELCASGGLLFIRRTTVKSGKAVVHETDRWLSKQARGTWLLLLAGRAC
ncbi:hypothetical protein GCM10017600_44660 [Streptosporangium carneum]|uniref:Uncharacterized protein n=1 Tax=Streptosporangium carneum TaxID=47481 RepID=A0A9W6I4Z9_9ACTN|nr:hypothetical protein GCM10017600_44660 [Streptosporangium carneum]